MQKWQLKTTSVALVALWILYVCYVGWNDLAALWVALALAPPFALALYLSFRSENLILRIFTAFCFVAHAFGAPYFWLTKENYSYSGFGAVGNFTFDLSELFVIYAWVTGLVLMVVCFTVLFDAIRLRPQKITVYSKDSDHEVSVDPPSSKISRRRARQNSYLIILLIVFVAAPMNVYMAVNNIGKTGVISDPLPFHLVGIMYYLRLYLIPLALMWLYAKCSHGWVVFAVIAAYGLLAGLSSASRTVLLLSLMPLIAATLSDRSKNRMIVLAVVVGVSFLATGMSRDYTYMAQEFSFIDMISATYDLLLSSSDVTPISIAGGIANRLYGAQDMVLSYQYAPMEPFASFVRYLWWGGRADAVVPDLTYDLYGMVFEEGSGFGVGLGTLAYLLMLGRANYALLLFGPLALALLLSLGNRILIWTMDMIREEKIRFNVRFFISLMAAFFIYSSSLNYYYSIMEVLLFLAFTIRFYKNQRTTLRTFARQYLY